MNADFHGLTYFHKNKTEKKNVIILYRLSTLQMAAVEQNQPATSYTKCQ